MVDDLSVLTSGPSLHSITSAQLLTIRLQPWNQTHVSARKEGVWRQPKNRRWTDSVVDHDGPT